MFSKSKNKYKNTKTTYKNIKFDSLLERDFYIYLEKQKEQGQVVSIKLQPVFLLQEGFRDYRGRAVRKIEYKADFEVEYANGQVVIYDTKGMLTKDFNLKYKMFLFKYNHLPLILVKKLKGGFYDKKTNEKII